MLGHPLQIPSIQIAISVVATSLATNTFFFHPPIQVENLTTLTQTIHPTPTIHIPPIGGETLRCNTLFNMGTPATMGKTSSWGEILSYGAITHLRAPACLGGTPRFGTTTSLGPFPYWKPTREISSWKPKSTLGEAFSIFLFNSFTLGHTRIY
jgi:hypothetical protein